MPFSAVSGNASPTFHHSKTADRSGRMMLRCMSPYVAPLRHVYSRLRSLFVGVERKMLVRGQIDANDPKPTSRNAKVLALESVPLRMNLEPKPNAFARLRGVAQSANAACDRQDSPAITAHGSAAKC
jgi:hypothetical protein